MSTLTLEEYRSLVSDLPRPTSQQICNFVEFVASAHSWYKRLPHFLPGIEFHFYLDAAAGCDRSISWLGKLKVTPRAKHGFHHSWIPTSEYLERFGYLAYSCQAGGGFTDVKLGGRIVSSDAIPTVRGLNGRPYALPTEVVDAGTVRLTAVFDTRTASPGLWDIPTGNADQAKKRTWPAESGGQATLEKILTRGRERRESKPADRHSPTVLYSENVDHWVDAEFYALMLPEQKRQRREAVEAMKRVCSVVYDTPGFKV
jgi:hypothetical protein